MTSLVLTVLLSLIRINLNKMKAKYITLLFSLTLLATACEKDKNEPDPVPTPISDLCNNGEYCFTDASNRLTVDYSGQTKRLYQLQEMTTYMKSANTSGVQLSADILRDMFSNANGAGSSHFSADASASGKQLEDKCFLGTVDLYFDHFDALESASMSVTAGTNGQAGVVQSISDPSKKYLLDANGLEWAQIIEKGLMGDVFYYQATATYLNGTELGTFDNSAPVNGDAGQWYSEAEHKFDEAFGYLGIPIDFASNTVDARFHGKYAVARNTALDISTPLFNAFIEARNAISNENESAKLNACEEIRYQWSRIIAGTSLYYLKQADLSINDPALKCHALSEFTAFIAQLIHNDGHSLSPAQVAEVLLIIGDNFYETSADDIANAQLFLINNTSITLEEFANL